MTDIQHLDEALDTLTEFICRTNKLSFTDADLSVFQILTSQNVTTCHDGVYIINDYRLLISRIVKFYKQTFTYEYEIDFSETISFINKIINLFNTEEFEQNLKLAVALFNISIVQTNKKHQTNFQQFITDKISNHESDTLLQFVSSYNQVINELTITLSEAYKNVVLLKEWLLQNDSFLYSQTIEKFKGLVTLRETQEGINIFESLLEEKTVDIDIFSVIISGLYNKIGYSFYVKKITPILTLSEKHTKASILGLANINNITNQEVELFIKIVNERKADHGILPELLLLLFSILKTDSFNDELYIQDVFSKIKEIIKLCSEDLITILLNKLTFFQKYEEEIINILEEIIAHPNFNTQKHCRLFGLCCRYFKNISSLRRIFVSISTNKPFSNIQEYLSTNYVNIQKEDYDKLLIDLISSNKASERDIGLNLFNNLSIEHPYKFDYNILLLSPINQYKLWVGLTQNYRDPKHFLPALFPILRSSSDIVQDTFIYKLEEYSENYGLKIVRLIKENMTIDQYIYEIIERIKKYTEDFYTNNIMIKKGICELDPLYTHNKLYTKFNKARDKAFENQTKRNMKESGGLMNLVKNIQLGKGGGWKMYGRTEISPLKRIESSFSLPREYFIMPINYEINMTVDLRTDWTNDDFKIIQEIIDNEQQ